MPSPLDVALNKAWVGRTLMSAGVIAPARPDRLVKLGAALVKWGATPAAGYAAAAARYPDEPAIVDELGTLSFQQVDERSNALARAWASEGIGEGDSIAILCRNHRGFIDATMACSKLGADALYLNTGFAGPQVTEVCEREKPVAMVFDEEFSEMVAEAAKDRKRYVGWFDSDEGKPDDPLLEDLIAGGDPRDLKPPKEKGKTVILTSGTTGTPKGASRSASGLDPVAALLSRIPLKARENTHIAAPLFHSWGFAHWALGLALNSTIVLRRKFTPEGALSACAQHECTALVVVPVMLQRMLELPEETLQRYDLSALKAIPASGSALPGELATRVMDVFGPKLYNLYGSTEVAWATIATPADLAAAPGTAGKPPRGTTVRIYAEDSERELPQGETGRIFVGNDMMFDGYTGGGSKDEIDGLMSSGDVGHFDTEGRLFVDGRDDDMIVSGGENVFPAEVEDLIADHADVKEVAVVGIDDEKFGQVLKAYVVPKDGQKLSADDIRKLVKDNLANYKVPKQVEFIEELPRNATGKVVKRDLGSDSDSDG